MESPSVLMVLTRNNARMVSHALLIRAVFNGVWKVIAELLWFCFTTLYDWFKKNSRNQLNQSDSTPNAIATWSYAFSRAWRRLRVFASSSHWLVLLLSFVVIGHCKMLWVCFYDTQLKTALMERNANNLFRWQFQIWPRPFQSSLPTTLQLVSNFLIKKYRKEHEIGEKQAARSFCVRCAPIYEFVSP